MTDREQRDDHEERREHNGESIELAKLLDLGVCHRAIR